MFKKPYEICVEHRYTPYCIRVVFFYRMEKWLNYALHGNIKIGADVTPLRMPSEADLCICDMPEKRMRKEGLQYANGKLAICESQKKE